MQKRPALDESIPGSRRERQQVPDVVYESMPRLNLKFALSQMETVIG
jgi:hypothetical protein